MSGSFTPPTTGIYTLRIENYRNVKADVSCLKNFIDNISLLPSQPDFEVSATNVDFDTGGAVDFSLHAGKDNGNMGYWIWMSVSGTYPGFNLTGQNVPLNWDALLEFGLYYPGFPGTVAFLGTLDGDGEGAASLTLPVNTDLLLSEMPIHFAYVVASSGFKLPVIYASMPVHVKYIP